MSVFYSIIIPAYNAEKYIEQCVQSVLAQTCRDYEILVISDGSDDRTEKIARKIAQSEPNVFFYGHSPFRRRCCPECGNAKSAGEICDLSGCG